MLLTLPYSFSQLGYPSGIVFQLFYGVIGCWSCYMITSLYVEYRTRKEREGVLFKNHVIQVKISYSTFVVHGVPQLQYHHCHSHWTDIRLQPGLAFQEKKGIDLAAVFSFPSSSEFAISLLSIQVKLDWFLLLLQNWNFLLEHSGKNSGFFFFFFFRVCNYSC